MSERAASMRFTCRLQPIRIQSNVKADGGAVFVIVHGVSHHHSFMNAARILMPAALLALATLEEVPLLADDQPSAEEQVADRQARALLDDALAEGAWVFTVGARWMRGGHITYVDPAAMDAGGGFITPGHGAFLDMVVPFLGFGFVVVGKGSD